MSRPITLVPLHLVEERRQRGIICQTLIDMARDPMTTIQDAIALAGLVALVFLITFGLEVFL